MKLLQTTNYRLALRMLKAVLLLVASSIASTTNAQQKVAECLLVEAMDQSLHYQSDVNECSLATSPASTFKLPHALIALDTGVVTDPLAMVAWDGTVYANESWNRDHSMDSAIKWSALWFFKRTAALIGRERMNTGLAKLHYAADNYAGEQTSFWLNGDLLVTPNEQMNFLQRLLRNELPEPRQHIDALKAAMLMPPGKVTMGVGEQAFELHWPALGEVHAKSGNASVNGETVSWLVGYFKAKGTAYVFVARARAQGALPPTAGVELAQRGLNAL